MRSPALSSLYAVLLTCAMLGSSAAAAGKIYRWIDEDGNVHFGERLPRGQAGSEVRFDGRSGGVTGGPGGGFYGMPVLPDAKILHRVERGTYPGILVYLTDMSAAAVLSYYQRQYGVPRRQQKVHRSQVLVYEAEGQPKRRVSVTLQKAGTQVDLLVER